MTIDAVFLDISLHCLPYLLNKSVVGWCMADPNSPGCQPATTCFTFGLSAVFIEHILKAYMFQRGFYHMGKGDITVCNPLDKAVFFFV